MKSNFILIFNFLIVLFLTNSFAQTEDKNDLRNMAMSAGAISITIGGNFVVTGTFPALMTERVDQFVTRLITEAKARQQGKMTELYMFEQIEEQFKKYPLRNITLKRTNGEEYKLDLIKFRKKGDFENNPYLKNDDVLIFPSTDIETNFFTVGGAVNNPGKFNFFEGDKLSEALLLADGINKAYENVEKVEISRLSYDGEKMDKKIVNINDDVTLQRGDRIIVLADETQRRAFDVVVIGEVNRPGIIPITKNNTNLKTVMEMAGGFTEQASLKKAKLFRGSKNIRFILENEFGLNLEKINSYLRGWPNPLLSEYQKNTMLRMSTLTEEDTAFFLVDEQIRQMVNDASVDFTNVMNENSETANLKVRDGDIIIIPTQVQTVYVYGQVLNPGLVKFSEGKDYKYYINLSGGLGELAADDDEIIIIKNESKAWLNAKENPTTIEPGDYIYVPKHPNKSFNYYLNRVGTYLGVVGSIATIILLLIQFNK